MARGTTGDNGMVMLSLSPGTFLVTSAPVAGFSEVARPVSVEVRLGEQGRVVLTHNTGFQ